MSNYLAIAATTAVIGQTLDRAMQAVPRLSAAPAVKFGRPLVPTPGFVGATLCLFQVSPNASLRNDDLVTRNREGQLLRRPRMALDLDYVISFYGDDSQLEPQRLLGRVVAALHAEPLLSAEHIRKTLDSAGPASHVADSDLDRQTEQIRLTPLNLSLEDISKMWSVFFQVPHALSVIYGASVVLVDSDLVPEAPSPLGKPRLGLAARGRDA